MKPAAETGGPYVRRILVPLLLPALGGLWIWVAMQGIRSVTVPLMLETGPSNTVLATYLWQEWGNGNVNYVGATGVAMILVMLLITLLLTRFGVTLDRASGG